LLQNRVLSTLGHAFLSGTGFPKILGSILNSNNLTFLHIKVNEVTDKEFKVMKRLRVRQGRLGFCYLIIFV
jgi:hypothetical protein